VLGDAAMLTSQYARSAGQEFRFGMSRRDTGNRQIALNVLHWFSRLLEEDILGGRSDFRPLMSNFGVW